jgi:small subunit ribosomal protein S17
VSEGEAEAQGTETGQPAESTGRGRRKGMVGVVVSDKMQKTVVVAVERLVEAPLYGRRTRRTRHYKAHDENGEAHLGDRVELVETRPLSKGKHWRVVRVLERAR